MRPSISLLVSRWIVRLAALRISRARRAEWIREWAAELQCHEGGLDRILRAAAAFRDAAAIGEAADTGGSAVGRRCRSAAAGWALDCVAAARALSRSPWFTVAVVGMLALGLASYAVIFGVIEAVLLRDLPYPEAARIVVAWEVHDDDGPTEVRVTAANYVDWRDGTETFDALALLANESRTLTGAGEPLQVSGLRVTPEYFSALGVEPRIGRPLRAADATVGAEPVVVVGHGLWQGRLGADPGIVGETILLDGSPVRVVGVMPAGRYPNGVATAPRLRVDERPAEIWTPLSLDDGLAGNRRSHVFGILGRLRTGSTIEAARAEMTAAISAAGEADGVVVRTLHDEIVGDADRILAMMLGAIVFLLLIVCANVAGLMLARGAGRRREVAIRLGLGASRGRLLRQILVEALILGLLAAVLALPPAAWGLRGFRALAPIDASTLADAQLGAQTLASTALLALLAVSVFGMVPALRLSTVDPGADLRGRSTIGSGPTGVSARSALIVVQVATAVVLVAGAGWMIRSVRNLDRVELGFEPDATVALSLSLPSDLYDRPESVIGFHDRLLDQLRTVAGAESVALAYDTPLENNWQDGFLLEGSEAARGSALRIVTPGYFETLGIGVVSGRPFRASDSFDGPGVAIVNREWVRVVLGGDEPLGRRLEMRTPGFIWSRATTTFELVGVVDDVRFAGVDRPPEPALYLSLGQLPLREVTALVKTAEGGHPTTLAATLRAAVWEVDPGQPIAEITTLARMRDRALVDRRFAVALLGAAGSVALILAAAGLYGVLAFIVARSVPELGLRMALGASGRRVVVALVGRSLRLVAIGALLGGALALALRRALAGLLFEVGATDPWVSGGVVAVLLATAAAATVLPASRAVRVDPASALQAD